jgi:hypothetical protein
MSNDAIHLEADLTLLDDLLQNAERRRAPRFSCGPVCLGHLTFGDDTFRLTVWPANLSETGIGFYVNWPLDPGTNLTIGLSKKSGGPITLRAKVIHSTKQEKSGWLVGCAFLEPLDRQTLEQLL